MDRTLEEELTSIQNRFIEAWDACNQSYLTIKETVNEAQKPLSALHRDVDVLLSHATWFQDSYAVDISRIEAQIRASSESHSEHWLCLNAKDLSALTQQLSSPQQEKSPDVYVKHFITVIISLLSKEPHYPANAKMNALECSILAFVHTSQEVIKTLTTHLHLLGPKSNSVVRFASESRCTRTSSFHEAHGDVTEIDASNLSDSVGTSSKTEDRERNLQEQLLSSRSSSNFKDPENALQISDQSSLPKEPVDLQKLISSAVSSSTDKHEDLLNVFFNFKRQRFHEVLTAVDGFCLKWQTVEQRGHNAVKRLKEVHDHHQQRYRKLDLDLDNMTLQLQSRLQNLRNRQQKLQHEKASAHLSSNQWSTSQALNGLWLVSLQCMSTHQGIGRGEMVGEAMRELQHLTNVVLNSRSSSEGSSGFSISNALLTQSISPLSLAEELMKASLGQETSNKQPCMADIPELAGLSLLGDKLGIGENTLHWSVPAHGAQTCDACDAFEEKASESSESGIGENTTNWLVTALGAQDKDNFEEPINESLSRPIELNIIENTNAGECGLPRQDRTPLAVFTADGPANAAIHQRYRLQEIFAKASRSFNGFFHLHWYQGGLGQGKQPLGRQIITRIAAHRICIFVCSLILAVVVLGAQIFAIIDQTVLEITHNYLDYEFRQMLRRDAGRPLHFY